MEKSISLKFVVCIMLIVLLFWLENVSLKYTDMNITRGNIMWMYLF